MKKIFLILFVITSANCFSYDYYDDYEDMTREEQILEIYERKYQREQERKARIKEACRKAYLRIKQKEQNNQDNLE